MIRLREDKLALFLHIATGAALFWLALTAATFIRYEDFYRIDFTLLQRDRFICLFIFLVSAGLAGLYRPSVISDRFDSLYYLMATLMATAVTGFVLAAVLPIQFREISRREIVLSLAIAAVLLAIWHIIAARIVRRFESLQTFFYVTGDEAEGKRIAAEIARQVSISAGAEYVSVERLKSCAHELAGIPYASDIVIAQPKPEPLREILEFCGQHFRRVFLYPALSDTLVFQHGKMLGLAGIPLIEVSGRQEYGAYLAVKRAIDIIVAATGLLLALPLIIVTTIAVKLSSPGPIFYLQERLGKDGKPFRIIKFRSMVSDGNDFVRSGKGDNRITRVGLFIRKYRIDEVPQLVNVLKGDMSLIGPRPLWRDFFRQNGESTPLWERRLVVRPGLTSLSHVMGSSFGEARDFLRYDLVYISTLSFMVDMRVFVATVRTVLSGRGA